MAHVRSTALAILLIPVTTVLGEEGSSQRIGFVAGPTYGVGLSYGRQDDSGLSWQVSGFPIWLERDRLLYGGVTLSRTLHVRGEGGVLRLFASAGLAAYYSWHEDDWQEDENLFVVFGPGIGLELRFGAFDVSADLPVAMVFSNDKSRNKTNFEIIPYIPNVACFYRW